MNKTVIAIVLTVIIGVIISLEYFLHPERSLPVSGSKNISTEERVTPYQKKKTYMLPPSQIDLESVSIASIQNVYKKRSNPISHIFGAVQFDVEVDGVQILKTDIADKASDRVLISVYEIFPIEDTTVSRLFSFLEQKFESRFVNDPETSVNRTDEFGLYSFYFNPSQSPEKAFLLVAKEQRVFGFEYIKANHNLLVPFFEDLS